jgi:dCTP deaminase
MILSDRENRAALSRGSIRITPDPREHPSLWTSTAIDLRLARELAWWEAPSVGGVRTPVDPSHPEFDYARLIAESARPVVITESGYVVEPRSLHLGWTMERICLPFRSRIAARVEGRSSLARLGLGVHITAPTIHAGFGYKEHDPRFPGNPIQLEIWNFGPLPIKPREGMTICQLILEEVHGTPEKGYEGQFAVQGPAVPDPSPSSSPGPSAGGRQRSAGRRRERS